MRVLITGTSSGIGRATAFKFIKEGHDVIGFDIQEAATDGGILQEDGITGSSRGRKTGSFKHYTVDIARPDTYPDLDWLPQILINNAGVQDSADDIAVNLKGTIAITERYALKDNPDIKAVVNVGSSSGITGSEFPEYAASKGGLIAYTKNIAMRLAPQATANCICPGGVMTDLNAPVTGDENLWQQIMDLTPLKRWATPEEIADWIYFLAVENTFMTGQSLLIDGGEAGNMHFVWPE